MIEAWFFISVYANIINSSKIFGPFDSKFTCEQVKMFVIKDTSQPHLYRISECYKGWAK